MTARVLAFWQLCLYLQITRPWLRMLMGSSGFCFSVLYETTFLLCSVFCWWGVRFFFFFFKCHKMTLGETKTLLRVPCLLNIHTFEMHLTSQHLERIKTRSLMSPAHFTNNSSTGPPTVISPFFQPSHTRLLSNHFSRQTIVKLFSYCYHTTIVSIYLHSSHHAFWQPFQPLQSYGRFITKPFDIYSRHKINRFAFGSWSRLTTNCQL